MEMWLAKPTVINVNFNATFLILRSNNKYSDYSLNDLVRNYGDPENLMYDGTAIQVGRHSNFQKSIRKYEIITHVSDPRILNQNPVEGAIRDIKNILIYETSHMS